MKDQHLESSIFGDPQEAGATALGGSRDRRAGRGVSVACAGDGAGLRSGFRGAARRPETRRPRPP